MKSHDPIEEPAPWWFALAAILVPLSLMGMGSLFDFWGHEIIILAGLLLLMLEAGAAIAIRTIYKNKTGDDLSESGEFDALWHIFIVQRRSRPKQ
jgi:hypothetical protein